MDEILQNLAAPQWWFEILANAVFPLLLGLLGAALLPVLPHIATAIAGLNVVVLMIAVISGMAPLTTVYLMDVFQAGLYAALYLLLFKLSGSPLRWFLVLVPLAWLALAAFAVTNLNSPLPLSSVLSVQPFGVILAVLVGMFVFAFQMMKALAVSLPAQNEK